MTSITFRQRSIHRGNIQNIGDILTLGSAMNNQELTAHLFSNRAVITASFSAPNSANLVTTSTVPTLGALPGDYQAGADDNAPFSVLHSSTGVIYLFDPNSGDWSAVSSSGGASQTVTVPIPAGSATLSVPLPSGYLRERLASVSVNGKSGVEVSDSVESSGGNLIFTITGAPADDGTHELQLRFES